MCRPRTPTSCGWNKSTGHTLYYLPLHSATTAAGQERVLLYCGSAQRNRGNRLHSCALRHPQKTHSHTSTASNITQSMYKSSVTRTTTSWMWSPASQEVHMSLIFCRKALWECAWNKEVVETHGSLVSIVESFQIPIFGFRKWVSSLMTCFIRRSGVCPCALANDATDKPSDAPRGLL